MQQTVLVIGSRGTVGSEVVKNLKALGSQVREATGKKAQTPDQVHLNLLTGEGRAQAFRGVDRAFFLSPAGYTEQSAILIPLIEEAKAQRLQKVVLMSAMGANASDAFPLRQAEIALEKSGLDYNIIRPNWFLQNFQSYWLHDILTHGKIRVPAGLAKVSFIDARDIARVATVLLTKNPFPNQAFDLTGPEAIDHAHVAKVLSEITGKAIGYQDIMPEEFKANLLAQGVPEDYANVLNMIMGFLKQGFAAPLTDAVEKITGRKPTGLLQYARDFRQGWL